MKESSIKSYLFKHTRIMFEFLLSELTKLKASLQIIQLLEEIMFKEGGLKPYKSAGRLINKFVSM